jgi:hypothetical protein
MFDRQNDVFLKVFIAFVISQAAMIWFSSFWLAPSFNPVRLQSILLLSSLWISVYLAVTKQMGQKARIVIFVSFASASIILGIFMSAFREAEDCEIRQVIDEKQVIYHCRFSISGGGTFRAQIDSPVMELLDFY